MTDRELLEALAAFLNGRTYIVGDKDSVADMVKRYANPPLTLYNRVAMRMTVTEHRRFMALLNSLDEHLKESEHVA